MVERYNSSLKGLVEYIKQGGDVKSKMKDLHALNENLYFFVKRVHNVMDSEKFNRLLQEKDQKEKFYY